MPSGQHCSHPICSVCKPSLSAAPETRAPKDLFRGKRDHRSPKPEGHELIPYCLRLQSLRTSGSLVSSETHKNYGRQSGEYHLRRKLRLPRVAQPRCERDGRRQAGDSKTHMLLLNREVLSETELLPKSPIPLETFVVRRHLLHQKLPKGKNTGCLDLGFPNLSVIILGAHWAPSLFPRQ